MNSTYTHMSSTIKKAANSKALSIPDSSFQSESLQRKADIANNAAQREDAPRPNNTGMPDNLKSGIENLSGFSMDDVRVHYNSSKPATVQALAYTQGTDIHVAPGQEKHLPHEAWHVAQQMAGRVSPTTNINGMPVNDNAGLEHEADVMGEKAAQCKQGYHLFNNIPKSMKDFVKGNQYKAQSNPNFIQRKVTLLTQRYIQANWPTKFTSLNSLAVANNNARISNTEYICNLNLGNNYLYDSRDRAKNEALTHAQNIAAHNVNLRAENNGETISFGGGNTILRIYRDINSNKYYGYGIIFHGREYASLLKNIGGVAKYDHARHCHAISKRIRKKADGSFEPIKKEGYTNLDENHFLINPLEE